jgi:hypothetical protein
MSRSQNKKTGNGGCTAPEIGARVHDYYNGALSAPEVREFERHLVSCRRCESIVLQLDEMMMLLQDDQDSEPHPGPGLGRGSNSSPEKLAAAGRSLRQKLCV